MFFSLFLTSLIVPPLTPLVNSIPLAITIPSDFYSPHWSLYSLLQYGMMPALDKMNSGQGHLAEVQTQQTRICFCFNGYDIMYLPTENAIEITINRSLAGQMGQLFRIELCF